MNNVNKQKEYAHRFLLAYEEVSKKVQNILEEDVAMLPVFVGSTLSFISSTLTFLSDLLQEIGYDCESESASIMKDVLHNIKKEFERLNEFGRQKLKEIMMKQVISETANNKPL